MLMPISIETLAFVFVVDFNCGCAGMAVYDARSGSDLHSSKIKGKGLSII